MVVSPAAVGPLKFYDQQNRIVTYKYTQILALQFTASEYGFLIAVIYVAIIKCGVDTPLQLIENALVLFQVTTSTQLTQKGYDIFHAHST